MLNWLALAGRLLSTGCFWLPACERFPPFGAQAHLLLYTYDSDQYISWLKINFSWFQRARAHPRLCYRCGYITCNMSLKNDCMVGFRTGFDIMLDFLSMCRESRCIWLLQTWAMRGTLLKAIIWWRYSWLWLSTFESALLAYYSCYTIFMERTSGDCKTLVRHSVDYYS